MAVASPSILYIEDNDDNIYMLSRRLIRRYYSVHEARTGADGIRNAVEMTPALIILDLVLPDIDGWEVARQLRDNVVTRNIPIIALSANVTAEDKGSALAAGCDEFEPKPVDFERLVTKIESLIS